MRRRESDGGETTRLGGARTGRKGRRLAALVACCLLALTTADALAVAKRGDVTLPDTRKPDPRKKRLSTRPKLLRLPGLRPFGDKKLFLRLFGYRPKRTTPKLWIERKNDKRNPFAPLTQDTIVELSRRLSPAVVNITVTRPQVPDETNDDAPPAPDDPPRNTPRRGLGTGFIINRYGMILTNYHVIEDATSVVVRLADNSRYPAKILGSDPKTDVALLQIQPSVKLTIAPLGSSKELLIGEWVMSIGNPFGLSHTVTAGIVSAKGRRRIQPGKRPIFSNFIQTDASINPGNSGGPLINMSGEVIGINTAINRAAQGIGFAIPIDMVKKLLPQLARGRVDRSWIGIKIAEVTRDLAKQLKMPRHRGALVTAVVEGGPAAKAGIRKGDVILTFAGEAIIRHLELPWLASIQKIGRTIEVRLWRNGREQRLHMVMGPTPKK
ncbi:MAG: trypsin-like peptidase domain-containing protein [Myxococcales bacterium]|nr:trypsin-like peptidase domain-containing protein [Myxococcales bacterium]